MGGERAPSACGCFSAASTVPHKRYNALVKQLYTKVRKGEGGGLTRHMCVL